MSESGNTCTHCNGTKRIPMFLPGSWADCDWCATPTASADPEPESQIDADDCRMVIDDEEFAPTHWTNLGKGYIVTMDCGREYMVFEDADEAGKAARAYWADMAANDPEEFACMVGQKTLVAWALGQYAGPGSSQVRSLEEWLDLHLDVPEEHFASYDSQECGVDNVSIDIVEDMGFTPTVAYRHN
jgi:hypothetical protein